MFNRFTQRAQKVLQLAQEEAIRMKHESIGTEHILLGLIREGGGIAAKALEAIGVSFATIEEGVEKLVGSGTKDVGPIVHYTPRAKKVIELSVDESRNLVIHISERNISYLHLFVKVKALQHEY